MSLHAHRKFFGLSSRTTLGVPAGIGRDADLDRAARFRRGSVVEGVDGDPGLHRVADRSRRSGWSRRPLTAQVELARAGAVLGDVASHTMLLMPAHGPAAAPQLSRPAAPSPPDSAGSAHENAVGVCYRRTNLRPNQLLSGAKQGRRGSAGSWSASAVSVTADARLDSHRRSTGTTRSAVRSSARQPAGDISRRLRGQRIREMRQDARRADD